MSSVSSDDSGGQENASGMQRLTPLPFVLDPTGEFLAQAQQLYLEEQAKLAAETAKQEKQANRANKLWHCQVRSCKYFLSPLPGAKTLKAKDIQEEIDPKPKPGTLLCPDCKQASLIPYEQREAARHKPTRLAAGTRWFCRQQFCEHHNFERPLSREQVVWKGSIAYCPECKLPSLVECALNKAPSWIHGLAVKEDNVTDASST